jgi:hypothetical protein
MILAFALVGAVIAFLPIPGTSVVLIGLEVFLLYRIQCKHNAFDLGSFIGVAAGLAGVSAVLKAMAAALILLPVISWLMSAAIAFGFIMIFGHIADGHYAKLALRNR